MWRCYFYLSKDLQMSSVSSIWRKKRSYKCICDFSTTDSATDVSVSIFQYTAQLGNGYVRAEVRAMDSTLNKP